MEVVCKPAQVNTANQHIAAGLIWASLCAVVLRRNDSGLGLLSSENNPKVITYEHLL
jgi:hypothetical protein